MKKYLAEMIGTMVLVLMGCGTAVSLNCGVDPASVVGTAIAFGLAVVAMAYTIGGISGCHINPAITLGCLLSGRISGKDAGMYMLFQVRLSWPYWYRVWLLKAQLPVQTHVRVK